jgi:hypothetical protein
MASNVKEVWTHSYDLCGTEKERSDPAKLTSASSAANCRTSAPTP